ncbi:hypothetical protein K1719_024151 [Acacia pycnantha]|nr:hypothetical protein K1719_024151 [Acacia pycnantha]
MAGSPIPLGNNLIFIIYPRRIYISQGLYGIVFSILQQISTHTLSLSSNTVTNFSPSATQTSDHSSNKQHQKRPFSEKRPQTVPGWDSMAYNDHPKDSYDSGSRTSEYEKWKQYIIDIENESNSEWNICKVPCTLRNLKPEAYTPQLVSIGPIHHDLKSLNPMQEQKLRYLKLFWSRVENKTEEMDKFKKFLEDREKDIRKCYAENLSRENLVEMMLLDSVFIMELFLRVQTQKSEEEEIKNGKNVEKKKYSDDIIMKQPWLNKSIQRDLLLLENQIPLFILEELYSTFVPNSRKKHATFIKLAGDYFVRYQTMMNCSSTSINKKGDSSSGEKTGTSDSKGEPPDEEKKSSTGFVQFMMNCGTNKKGDSSSGGKTASSDSQVKPKHFTDLIRSFYICKDLHEFKKGSPLKTATKLRESGVSFEKVDHKPLLDIKFKKIPILSWFLCLGCIPHSRYFKARLQIPELKVDDTTECVLRNLIAFEQCHYPNQPYICNYVSFIDSLIHTKDDVELLVEKEVIMHELGSDKEVATLVNGLCKHVVTDKTCYEKIIKKLNKHYQRQWYRTMAALRLVYFRDTWRASSTLVATAVLVFTIFNFCRVVRLVLDLDQRRRP